MTTNAHLTIENVEKLARLIVSKFPGVGLVDARELAEFNLRYSASYAAAAARVRV